MTAESLREQLREAARAEVGHIYSVCIDAVTVADTQSQKEAQSFNPLDTSWVENDGDSEDEMDIEMRVREVAADAVSNTTRGTASRPQVSHTSLSRPELLAYELRRRRRPFWAREIARGSRAGPSRRTRRGRRASWAAIPAGLLQSPATRKLRVAAAPSKVPDLRPLLPHPRLGSRTRSSRKRRACFPPCPADAASSPTELRAQRNHL